jgi:hypothetical protein
MNFDPQPLDFLELSGRWALLLADIHLVPDPPVTQHFGGDVKVRYYGLAGGYAGGYSESLSRAIRTACSRTSAGCFLGAVAIFLIKWHQMLDDSVSAHTQNDRFRPQCFGAFVAVILTSQNPSAESIYADSKVEMESDSICPGCAWILFVLSLRSFLEASVRTRCHN